MGGKSSSEKEGKGSPPPSVNREERLRIALIGVRGVGKSNIIFRTLTGNFYEYAHDFPLEEIYGTNRIIDEKVVHVEFLDNLGFDESQWWLEYLPRYTNRDTHFLLMYSIADRQSFRRLPLLREAILRVCDTKKMSATLVGTKKDLESQREVRYEEGLALAATWDCPFFEISAKDEDLDTVSPLVDRAVRARRNPKQHGGGNALLRRHDDVARTMRRDLSSLAMLRDQFGKAIYGEDVRSVEEGFKTVREMLDERNVKSEDFCWAFDIGCPQFKGPHHAKRRHALKKKKKRADMPPRLRYKLRIDYGFC
mmetsp:Transcript_29140/g.54562  ORF Transcript_29140/g.54562 Transcript_29140/m.54562 type:complete len:309 (-) Transcript_29140:20-946(-)